jgi:hypothetical protein
MVGGRQGLTSLERGVLTGDAMAALSLFSIVAYERKLGHWRAAITPIRRSGTVIQGRTTSSIVTPDDFSPEADATFAAEKMILKL